MKANEILKKRKLRRTNCRENIIDVITDVNHALSEHEIRQRLDGNYDRTTFYRSFKTLVEHKIIHRIVVDNHLVKYELDNSISSKKEHCHFYCGSCKTVKCLDMIDHPQPLVPRGYTINEMALIIKGECEKCSKQNKGDSNGQ